MLKMIAFLVAFLPSVFSNEPMPETTTCTCGDLTDVQKTGQGSGTISFDWSSSAEATQYKLWYVRQSDGYTSSAVMVTPSNYTYSGLAAGQHTFYFVKMCGTQGSNIIGIEDHIQE